MLSLNARSDRQEGLTLQDYCTAAHEIGCAVSMVRAVDAVESAGRGFLPSGRPKILFEGHLFHKFTGGKFSHDYPTISYPHWTRAHYLGGEAEYTRLEKAYRLDPTAALRATSWSRFQILGDNFRACGYTNVEEYVADMFRSEDAALEAFVKYVIRNHIASAMIRKDAVAFALKFNGPSERKNGYDGKITAAERKFAAMKVSCQGEKASTAPTPIDTALPTDCHDTCVGLNNTHLDSRYEKVSQDVASVDDAEDSNQQDNATNTPADTTSPNSNTTDTTPSPSNGASPARPLTGTSEPVEGDDSNSSSSSWTDRLKGKADAAVSKLQTVQDGADRVTNATAIFRADETATIRSTVSHHIAQIGSFIAFWFLSVPVKYWIVLAVILVVCLLAYRRRDTLSALFRGNPPTAA